MAFNAGAVIGKAILDTTEWISGTKAIQNSSKTISDGIKNIGKIVASASAIIVAGITTAVIEANKFNKEFANVSTLIDPAIVDIKTMKGELLGLDSRLGSATELTQGLYEAISASIDPANAVKFVGEAAIFAKAALIDTNTAVDVLTTGLNAYGYQADQAGRISDILFQTIMVGKTNGEELSATIGNVIPMAASMGLSFENLGASIAEMTKQGIGSAESTTQLSAVMTELLKPSDELKTAMNNAGFATGDAVTKSDNFQEALQKIIAQTDGSKEALAKLFPQVNSLRAVMALTGEGSKNFANTLDQMKNSSGSTQVAFEKQEITFETLSNSVNKLWILIGERFLPVILQSAGGLITLIDELASSGKAFDTLTNIISTGAAIFETMKTIVIEFINTAIKVSQEEIGKITSQLKLLEDPGNKTNAIFQAIALAMNIGNAAIRIVIKTFSGLVQTLINIINVGKSVVNVFGTVWDVIQGKKKLGDIADSFFKIGDSFKNLGVTIFDTGKELVDEYAKSINDIFSKQQETASKLQVKAIEVMNNTKKAINDTATSIISTEQKTVDIRIDMQNQLTENIKNNNNEIKKDTETVVKEMLDFWENMFNNVILKSTEATEKIKEKFKQFQDSISTIYSVLTDIVNRYFQNEIERAEEGSQKQKELKEQQFNATKASAIIESIINTAIAVSKALTLGPILGPIMAGIIGTLGAVQTALIASQPMPRFQFGTSGEFFATPNNEDFIAAFQKDEIINVQNENEAMNNNSNRPIILQNIWNDRIIGEEMFRISRNGLMKISNRAVVAI